MGFGEKVAGLVTKVAMMFAEGKAKLLIHGENSTDEIPVHFNPSEYKVSRTCSFSERELVKQTEALFDFKGADYQTLTVKLYFDDDVIEAPGGSVAGGAASLLESAVSAVAGGGQKKEDPNKLSVGQVIKKLEALTKFEGQQHMIPACTFVYGTIVFSGFVKTLTVNCTMFDEDGRVIRATVDLTMIGLRNSDAEAQIALQSPDRTKLRRVTDSTSLWSLAGAEYDDPREWRRIADANGIMNPLDIPAGRELRIPPMKYK